jgi:hypothetical protein
MAEPGTEARPIHPLSPDALRQLREEYTSYRDIRCRVCGAAMTLSNSSTNVYNCTSDEASLVKTDLFTPEGKASRKHYEDSAWYDRRPGDKRVLDLIDEIEWRRRGAGRLTDREVAEEFTCYWAPLITGEDGQIDLALVAKEFGDYSWLLRSVPLAYDRATSGRVSHPFTLPEIVGQQTEERLAEASAQDQADLVREVITELGDVLPDDPAALDAVTRYLQQKLAGLEK